MGLGAPRGPEGRLGPLGFSLVMFSMASCLPLFFLGPIAYRSGLTLGQALAAALIGNLVVAAAMALNGHAGVAEGIGFQEQARRVYGVTAGRAAVALRGLVGALWFGVEAYNGALALVMIALMAVGHSGEGLVAEASHLVPAALALYLALMLVVMRGGMEAVGRAATLAGPLMMLYFAWLALWLHGRGAPAAAPRGVPWASAAFLAYLAIQTNWWATVAVNMSDLSRVARSWGAVWAGVLAGMVGGQALGTYLGYVLAAETGKALPQEIIAAYAPGALAVSLGLIFSFLAPWTTDITANVPALADLVAELSGAPWGRAAAVAVALGFVLAPWWALGSAQDIVGYVAGFAASYGVILGPLLGPMIASHWLAGKRLDPQGGGRTSWPAVTGFLAGVALSYAASPLLGGLARARIGPLAIPFPAGPAWYVGTAASLAVYLAVERASGRRGS